MNYAKLLLSLLIGSSCFTSFPHELLTQKNIREQAVSIERKMTRDRYIVYGLTALSIAHQLYPWIAVYQKGLENSQKDSSQKLSMFQSIKAAFNHLFYTQEGWMSLAQASVSLGGAIVISQVCNTFIHPDTLRWYVYSYAPYAITTQMMKERLTLLQTSVDEQQRVDATTFLHLLYRRLVRQSTSMCAYMVYKTKYLVEEEKEIAQRAVRILIAAQNHYLQSIAQQLNAEVVDYQELEKILSQYEADTNAQVNHFSVIEGETMEDRYVVKQLIKRSLQK